MTLKRQLLDLIDLSESIGGQVIERPDRTEIDCQDIPGALLTAAIDVAAACQAAKAPFEFFFKTVSSKTIAAEDAVVEELAGREISIVIIKKVAAASAIFFTLPGFAKNLENADFLSRIRSVELIYEFSPFANYLFAVKPFGGAFEPQIDPWTGQDNALSVVKDHTGSLAPKNLLPWLLAVAPVSPSDIFNVWAIAATRRLALAIPTEITLKEGARIASFKGQRTVDCALVDTAPDVLSNSFRAFHEAVIWVYSVKTESASKHVLLANQLSLELRQDQAWPDDVSSVLSCALKSAQEAYRLHLLDKSKDVLKSLSDLRKSLSDELAQSNRNMQQAASNLWRDFAVSAAVIGLRFAATKVDQGLISWIAALGAIFLFLSLFITLYGNWRYEVIARDSRFSWRGKIYSFMDDDEFRKLVEAPISKMSRSYKFTATILAVVYLSIISYFVYLSSSLWMSAIDAVWAAYGWVMTRFAELLLRLFV